MTTEELLRAYIEHEQSAAELEHLLENATERHALYRLIVKQQPRAHRLILLRLLDKEISYRTAVWDGSIDFDEESADGIFHCAYLLSRCGEPADVRDIWKAQYLNQDVGELEVGFFLGSGEEATLAFLAKRDDETSRDIAEYIRLSLGHPDASEWLKSWETYRHALLVGDN